MKGWTGAAVSSIIIPGGRTGFMSLNLGVICSDEAPELAAVLEAAAAGEAPASIRLVIADRDSAALSLARSAGLYGALSPVRPITPTATVSSAAWWRC